MCVHGFSSVSWWKMPRISRDSRWSAFTWCPPPDGPALRPPGLHTTTRELQTCAFERPGASNTPPKSNEKPNRGKKKHEILGSPAQEGTGGWCATLGVPPLDTQFLRRSRKATAAVNFNKDATNETRAKKGGGQAVTRAEACEKCVYS